MNSHRKPEIRRSVEYFQDFMIELNDLCRKHRKIIRGEVACKSAVGFTVHITADGREWTVQGHR